MISLNARLLADVEAIMPVDIPKGFCIALATNGSVFALASSSFQDIARTPIGTYS